MKFTIASTVALLAYVASAFPTGAAIQKRAGFDDACDVGFATMNGGTTGGGTAAPITVKSYAELAAAAKKAGPAVILVQGNISGNKRVTVTSDKTIIGAPGSSLTGAGIYGQRAKNIIIRNMKISKVSADGGDAIAFRQSTNIWVDHCDLSSDREHGKDFYDGLADFTHATDFVTVSNTHFHDHFKVSLVGHSDSNAKEDTGKLRVTYANNHWSNVGSRLPSVRFGTAHVFNSLFSSVETSAVNTRMGAQVLVESSVFEGVKNGIASLDSKQKGGAVVKDVVGAQSSAPAGTLNSVPYKYTVLGSGKVKAAVSASAGQTLKF
ncbi:hypothetical protein MAPG_05118 [Magnaporthiopsis poae ATCC 64411]|uniref:Pectate lyase domain-containing protein n=1 Tax=Magnaporthiopsis poae (strain ATCC 64411 / 73-15) TaxID=644358 RepID=A0A0C4DYJ6_MAGP6|nr:hypothetical protein MAPG_05118 [Magnaporthiopsis poae ATCC 64411]